MSKNLFLTLLSIALSGLSRVAAQPFVIDDIPLTWKDFTLKEGFHNHPFTAYTYTQILPYRYELKKGKIEFEQELIVNHDKSWVKEEFMEKASKEQKQQLLNHEKGHLIIALINLRQSVNTFNTFVYSSRNYKKELDSISKESYNQLKLMNETYDSETNHMKLTDKQTEWMNNLLKQLNEWYADDKKIYMKFDVEIHIPQPDSPH